MLPDLSILIPVRNETLNIKVMVKVLSAIMEIPYEVLVIYDSEEDKSIPVLKELTKEFPNVRSILNKEGIGVANAIKAGVDNAKSSKVLIFAADELGPAFAINKMLALMDAGCEFISCTRYAYGGKRYGGSFIGHVLSKVANTSLRLLTSMSFTDATTGIKVFLKKDFDKLLTNYSASGWSLALQMAINAQVLGLKLGEVPIVSIDRLFGGESTFSLLSWVRGYMKFFIRAIIKLPFYKSRPLVWICMRGKN